MTSKRIGLGALCIAAIATFVLVTSNLSVSAQTADTPKTGPPPNAVTTPNAKEVTMTGRVVDFQCFMTGQAPSADVTKCAAPHTKLSGSGLSSGYWTLFYGWIFDAL